jgi:hypothetical protein
MGGWRGVLEKLSKRASPPIPGFLFEPPAIHAFETDPDFQKILACGRRACY